MKRLQNRIAESGIMLPVMAVYALAVWLLSGLTANNWWPQLACYAATSYLVVEMSNSNALLRVRSRMVSCTFIMLTCMLSPLFGSMTNGLTLLFWVAAMLILFSTYQDHQAVGRVFYAFVFLSAASIVFVQSLWLVPVIWLLMLTQLQSLGWRTWLASIIGLLAPYWFFTLWFIYTNDFTPLFTHMAGLWEIEFSVNYTALQPSQVAAYILTFVLTLTGIIHFWHRSFEDKIRIRLLYGFFTTMSLLLFILIALLPQYFDPLIRMAFLFACPLVAHLATFTSTRISNIMFFVILALIVTITVLNLWTFSLRF